MKTIINLFKALFYRDKSISTIRIERACKAKSIKYKQ